MCCRARQDGRKRTLGRYRGLMRRVIRRVALFFGVTAAIAAAWAGYLRLSGNFHTVERGLLYRSSQLSFEQFERDIRANDIKTVINLRGENPSEAWYRDELRATSETKALHIDFPLSAIREVSDEKLERLAELLREAPKPILVHCEGGADRSGLASALFELVIAKRPPSVASEQLSFRYGHFPWLGSRTIAMDKSFDRLAARAAPVSPAASITSDR